MAMGLDEIDEMPHRMGADLSDCLLKVSCPGTQSFAFYALTFGAENASIKVAKGGRL
jgi:hypothetical protein